MTPGDMAENHGTNDRKNSTAAVNALRSDNVVIQNEGVAAAIRIGAGLVSDLLTLLEERGVNRALVLYALAQIGDSRAEQAFLAGLRDSDERVRGYAAEGLARIGHPDAMAACLQTLNDAADALHIDMTPSVQALGAMGLKVVPPLLELLTHQDELTRLRSQRALELILSRRHGFEPGHGFPSEAAAESTRAQWRANGDYDYRADANSRSASVALWRRWLAGTKGT
jgi:HEAT repeat protein